MTHYRQFTERQTRRARQCLDAYGADVTKWPQKDRALYPALGRDGALSAAHAAAGDLDAFLAAATAPAVSAELGGRIADKISLNAPKRDWFEAVGRLFQFDELSSITAGSAALAFALVGAIGLAAGLASADAPAGPEYEAYAYLQYADLGASEEELSQWDAD